MKRIDTHTDPKISKHFAFNPQVITRMVARRRRVGLDALALTAHVQRGVRHSLVHTDALAVHSTLKAIGEGSPRWAA